MKYVSIKTRPVTLPSIVTTTNDSCRNEGFFHTPYLQKFHIDVLKFQSPNKTLLWINNWQKKKKKKGSNGSQTTRVDKRTVEKPMIREKRKRTDKDDNEAVENNRSKPQRKKKYKSKSIKETETKNPIKNPRKTLEQKTKNALYPNFVVKKPSFVAHSPFLRTRFLNVHRPWRPNAVVHYLHFLIKRHCLRL